MPFFIYVPTLCINTYSQVVIALVRLCKCVGLSELLLFSFAIVPKSHGLAHLIFSLYLHMVMLLNTHAIFYLCSYFVY